MQPIAVRRGILIAPPCNIHAIVYSWLCRHTICFFCNNHAIKSPKTNVPNIYNHNDKKCLAWPSLVLIGPRLGVCKIWIGWCWPDPANLYVSYLDWHKYCKERPAVILKTYKKICVKLRKFPLQLQYRCTVSYLHTYTNLPVDCQTNSQCITNNVTFDVL